MCQFDSVQGSGRNSGNETHLRKKSGSHGGRRKEVVSELKSTMLNINELSIMVTTYFKCDYYVFYRIRCDV